MRIQESLSPPATRPLPPHPSPISTSFASDGRRFLMRLWVCTSGCLHICQMLVSPVLT